MSTPSVYAKSISVCDRLSSGGALRRALHGASLSAVIAGSVIASAASPGAVVGRSAQPAAPPTSPSAVVLSRSMLQPLGPAAPSPAAAGADGAASPILRAHLSASEKTRLVLEIDSSVKCAGALQVAYFELAAPPLNASFGEASWKSRLVGSRFLRRSSAMPGEILELELPSEVFGSVHSLGALVISDTYQPGVGGSLAFTSVALPPQDPSDAVAVPPAPGSIVVTEFMKDPMAVSDARGEWVEVQNRSDRDIDIEGWTLRDDGSNSTVLVGDVTGEGIVVPAGGFLLLGRNGDAAINGGVRIDDVYSGFTLGNGEDQIVLEAPGGFLVDRVDYLDGGNGGWPDASGASIALSPRFVGSPAAADGSSWCSGTEPMPFGDLGTPGEVNSDC